MQITHLVPILWGRIELRMPDGRRVVKERWIFTDAFSSVAITTHPSLLSLVRFLEWFDPERSYLCLETKVDQYSPFQLVTLSVVDQLVRWDDERKANQFVGHLIDMSALVLRLYHLNPGQVTAQTIYNVLKFLELAHDVGIFDVAMLRKELTNIKKSGGVPDVELGWYDFLSGAYRTERLPEMLQSLIDLSFGRG